MKKNLIELSVIVPIYNVENYLKRGIESILNQNLENIEIILINDGSTDNSLEICKEYAEKDKRIVLVDKEKEGVSIARNIGIEKATSEYIIFFDPDDEIEKNMYSDLYNSMKINKVDICFCNYKRIKNIEEKFDEFKDIIDEKNNIKIDKLINKIIGGNSIEEQLVVGCVWRSIFKKEIIEKYNVKFPEKITPMQDLVFIIEYLTKCKSAYLDKRCYYKYFINAMSSTNRYRSHLLENNIQVCTLLEKVLIDNKILDNNEVALRNRWMISYMSVLNNETKGVNKINKRDRINKIRNILKNSDFYNKIESFSYSEVTMLRKVLIWGIKNRKANVIFYGYILKEKYVNMKEKLQIKKYEKFN